MGHIMKDLSVESRLYDIDRVPLRKKTNTDLLFLKEDCQKIGGRIKSGTDCLQAYQFGNFFILLRQRKNVSFKVAPEGEIQEIFQR